MSNFWPDDLDIKDIQSPIDILKTAQEDWRTKTDGVMELVLQNTESKAGNPMIIVHAKHVPSNRTVTLFSIAYRPDKPYPATINLKEDELPNFLKKAYEIPASMNITNPGLHLGSIGTNKLLESTLPRTIRNTLVSDTPSEFRKKLSEVFNEGSIKRQILNIVSIATDNVNNINGESLEDSVEN